MNVLWITNYPLPIVQKELHLKMNPKEGWLVQLSDSLSKLSDVYLCVVSPSEELTETDMRIVGNIRYVTYPKKLVNRNKIGVFFKNIANQLKPDVIHIQGSENSYGLHWVNSCGNKGVVVSIQGMPSGIFRYALGGVSAITWFLYTTLGDLIKFGNVVQEQRKMKKRGMLEKKLLQSVQHVIGRTEWDKAYCWVINPNLNYHFCNESLRKIFYENVWSYEKCIKHSIFLPQATVPYKGAHKVIEACSIVKKFFSDVKIIIPQCVNLDKSTFLKRLTRRNYGKYIEHLLKKFDMESNVVVKGTLSEKGMLNEYLKCNVFISPASIENSPNSLGEAQLLGVPTLASYVGGTDVIADYGKATPLYRFEEVEMLAYKIIQLFKNGPDYEQINYARKIAQNRHDLEKNTMTLYNVYKQIVGESC